jgi:hypothetical protein
MPLLRTLATSTRSARWHGLRRVVKLDQWCPTWDRVEMGSEALRVGIRPHVENQFHVRDPEHILIDADAPPSTQPRINNPQFIYSSGRQYPGPDTV